MDRRLGRPLPHQLPNPTRADPLPINLSPVGLMRYYSQFPRAIPQQRARSHALLTRPPLEPKSSLDLHVLGLPPAFVLSQDQTLKLKAAEAAVLDRRTLHICPSTTWKDHLCLSFHNSEPSNSEADTWIIGFPTRPIRKAPQSKNDQTARISLQKNSNVKKQRKQNRGRCVIRLTPRPVSHSQIVSVPLPLPRPVRRCRRSVSGYLDPTKQTRKTKNEEK